jgi:hypothetical protein
VSRGVVVALLGAGLSACLVPQSVDPDVTRPHTVPIVDLRSLPAYMFSPEVQVYLPGSTDTSSAPPCRCVLHLEIPEIKDEDPTVNLEARWFVDYDLAGSAQSQSPVAVQVLNGSFNATGQFRGAVVFDFDPVTLGLTKDDSVHIIEMVIAEQQGFTPDSQAPFPPHRAFLNGWDGTTFKIISRVHASAASQCDRNVAVISPPVVRICQ